MKKLKGSIISNAKKYVISNNILVIMPFIKFIYPLIKFLTLERGPLGIKYFLFASQLSADKISIVPAVL